MMAYIAIYMFTFLLERHLPLVVVAVSIAALAVLGYWGFSQLFRRLYAGTEKDGGWPRRLVMCLLVSIGYFVLGKMPLNEFFHGVDYVALMAMLLMVAYAIIAMAIMTPLKVKTA